MLESLAVWALTLATLPLFVILLALVLSGCSAILGMEKIDLPKVLEALAKDPASVCLRVPTPAGIAQLARTAIVGGTVTCTENGLTVKSDAR